jgi:hypothetical protein
MSVNEENIIDRVAGEKASEDESPKSSVLTFDVGAAAEEGDLEALLALAPFTGAITAVSYTPKSAVAEGAAIYRTYSIENKGAKGEGTTVAAKYSTKEGSAKKEKLVAEIARALGLEATANTLVKAGDVLKFKNIHTGKALAETSGVVTITIARVVHTGPANNAFQEAGYEGVE